MIYVTAQTQVMLAIKPADFRKQIDGLVAVCQQQLKQNPRSSTLFVFINKTRTMIRILSYDGSGYWLATKRLSKGKYSGWPNSDSAIQTIESKNLLRLIKTNLSSQNLSSQNLSSQNLSSQSIPTNSSVATATGAIS